MTILLARPTLEVGGATAGHGGTGTTGNWNRIGWWGKGEGRGWEGDAVHGREVLALVDWGGDGAWVGNHRQGVWHKNMLRGMECDVGRESLLVC
jgi:hypothetical protein